MAPEFLRGTKKDPEYERVDTPLIVFINARSGGRVGPALAARLSRALGRAQVRPLRDSQKGARSCTQLQLLPG